MERYEIVVDDEGNYCGLIPSENGPLVQYADAQATIAALQARVQECEAAMEKQVAILEEINKLDAERAAFVVDLKAQLTQRTAELEAANDKVQFLEKKNRNLLDSENLTLKVKADQDVRLASLQAELERVRGERDHAKKMEAVQKEVADNQTWHVQKLRTLILALPKVDGEIEIYTGKNTNQVVVTYKRGVIIGTLYGLDHAKPVAALYKHRQGMEG